MPDENATCVIEPGRFTFLSPFRHLPFFRCLSAHGQLFIAEMLLIKNPARFAIQAADAFIAIDDISSFQPPFSSVCRHFRIDIFFSLRFLPSPFRRSISSPFFRFALFF